MAPSRMLLHIGDYRRDTGHLTTVEHGAYLLLIMHYWVNGGLPDNDRQIARIAGLSVGEWKKIRPTIRSLFKDNWKHKRVEEELGKAKAGLERMSEGGRRGNASRWGSGGDRQPDRPPIPERSGGDVPAAIASRSPPYTLNLKEHDDDGDARARELPDHFPLTEQIAAIAGFPDPKNWPPGWCGAYDRVKTWLNRGWTPELILIGVRSAMARKTGDPPYSADYFDKPIAKAVAMSAKPLPTVVVQPGETVHVREAAAHPGGAYGASKDEFRNALAELRERNRQNRLAAQSGDDGGAGATPELLPPARHE